jgi:hypothetical protein
MGSYINSQMEKHSHSVGVEEGQERCSRKLKLNCSKVYVLFRNMFWLELNYEYLHICGNYPDIFPGPRIFLQVWVDVESQEASIVLDLQAGCIV